MTRDREQRRAAAPDRFFAAALVLLSAACSPADETRPAAENGGTAPPAAAVSDAPADSSSGPSVLQRVADLQDLRAEETSEAAGAFSHDPHRRIACSTCHVNPPGHSTHEGVRCSSCHGYADAATATVTRPAECAACHHAERRAGSCTDCHDDPAGPPDVRLSVTIDVAGAPSPPVRDLLFRHGVHAALACTTCHGSGDAFEVVAECVSCHRLHHRPATDCLSCHAPLPLDTHDRTAHDGCAGAACHDDPTVLALPGSRSVCLACHQDQVSHEPGRECAGCHLVDDAGDPGSTEPARPARAGGMRWQPAGGGP